MIQWVESLGLTEFATNLRESGVHGGIVAMDNDCNYEKLALALQIPLASVEVCVTVCMCEALTNKLIPYMQVRHQLRNEFNRLLSEGTNRASSEVSGCGQWVWSMTEISYTLVVSYPCSLTHATVPITW